MLWFYPASVHSRYVSVHISIHLMLWFYLERVDVDYELAGISIHLMLWFYLKGADGTGAGDNFNTSHVMVLYG